MTTRLTRPVSRMLDDGHGGLVVTLALDGIHFRIARTRTIYVLPYGMAFLRAGQLAAEEKVAERGTRRSTSRGLLRRGL